MNYKIDYLNNGEEIVNPKVEGLVNIEVRLTDENGDKFGINFPVNIERVKIDDKSVLDSAKEYLKQFEA